MQLASFVRDHRKAIAFAVSLVIIENVAWIIEPTVFGRVIDAFIDKGLGPFSEAFLLPLGVWIGVFLVNSGVGTVRRSLDPRIYLRMFAHIALTVADEGFKQGHSVSKTAARAELMREYIAFFQYRIPEIIEQAISVAGAILALAFFDLRIAIACLTVALPLGFVTARYSRKISAVQATLHDTREQAYDAFSTKDLNRIEQYFAHLTGSEQRIAHWGALNFGIVRLSLLCIFLVVIYISIDLDDFTTGDIFAIVAYLWTFVTSTEYLPELLESWTSLRELNVRMRGKAATSPLQEPNA